jgi:hypothetical protein
MSISTFADLLRSYLRVSRRRRPIMPVPMPGTFARAIRDGALLVPADARTERASGRRTWEGFLAERLG